MPLLILSMILIVYAGTSTPSCVTVFVVYIYKLLDSLPPPIIQWLLSKCVVKSRYFITMLLCPTLQPSSWVSIDSKFDFSVPLVGCGWDFNKHSSFPYRKIGDRWVCRQTVPQKLSLTCTLDESDDGEEVPPLRRMLWEFLAWPRIDQSPWTAVLWTLYRVFSKRNSLFSSL